MTQDCKFGLLFKVRFSDLDLNVRNGIVDDSQSSLPRVHIVGGNALASEEIHHVTAEFLINEEEN